MINLHLLTLNQQTLKKDDEVKEDEDEYWHEGYEEYEGEMDRNKEDEDEEDKNENEEDE